MTYIEKSGFVLKEKEGKYVICIPDPSAQGHSSCSGCGVCARRPDEITYIAASKEPLSLGDPVLLKIPDTSFSVSIFCLFILPLLLIAAGTFLAVQIWSYNIISFAIGLLGSLICWAGINIFIQRFISRKYPLILIKKN